VICNESLNAVDSYFERRGTQGAAETKPNKVSSTGIAAKKPVFGGVAGHFLLVAARE